MKNIYFISESIPYRGYGSFVIFYRHLLRLEKEGYQINLIIPNLEHPEADVFLEEVKHRWNIVRVPFKKWWFLLPYRYNYPVLREIRYRFVSLHLKKNLKHNPPNFILTYFYDQFFNGLAVFLKNKFNCGLGIFLHDDKYLLNNNYLPSLLKYDQFLTKNASVVWSVSNDLFIPGTDTSKFKLLYPIPGGDNNAKINWQDNYSTPVIGFSGSIYPEYEEVFSRLADSLTAQNGRLILIINNPIRHTWLTALTLNYTNIIVVESFKNLDDTFNYLKNNCSALFCGYPEDINKMPWIKTSFPSKFVEFSHLGLPIILTSPLGTALYKWANEQHWKLFSSRYKKQEIDQIIKDISDKESWSENAAQTLKISNTIFDPVTIHHQFLADIERNIL